MGTVTVKVSRRRVRVKHTLQSCSTVPVPTVKVHVLVLGSDTAKIFKKINFEGFADEIIELLKLFDQIIIIH